MASAAIPSLTPAPTFAHAANYRYWPNMKTKAGEIAALEHLSPAARARTTPLFRICEEVKPSFPVQLVHAWVGNLIALDGAFNFGHSGNATTFAALTTTLRTGGVFVMPCWSMSDPAGYQHAAASFVDQCGAVLRVSLGQASQALAWVQSLGLSPSAVDLIIDMKHLGSIDIPSFGGYVASVINDNAATLIAFRSVALASACAPKDNSALSVGVNRISRLDWQLWSVVRTAVPLRLDYSDYLTTHPDITEPPGAAMAKATVSARYSLDTCLLIIKGRSTNGPNGLPMRQQYRSHASLISTEPGFAGVNNVWADGQIGQAAAGAQGLASRAKWSGFSANRHISLIADRLP